MIHRIRYCAASLALLLSASLSLLGCGPDALSPRAPSALEDAQFGYRVVPYDLVVLQGLVGEGEDDSVPAGVFVGVDQMPDFADGKRITRLVERRLVISHSGRAMLAAYRIDASGDLQRGKREKAQGGRAGDVWFIRMLPTRIGREATDVRLDLTPEGIILHLPRQHITAAGLVEETRAIALERR